MMRMFILAAVVTLISTTTSGQAAMLFDGVASFSTTQNPNGVWSYHADTAGSSPGLGVATTRDLSNRGLGLLDGWSARANFGTRAGGVLEGEGGIVFQPSRVSVLGGTLAGSFGLYWTAPESGIVDVSFAFESVGSLSTDSPTRVGVAKFGLGLWSETIEPFASTTGIVTVQANVQAGDQIRFNVLGDDFSGTGNTPVLLSKSQIKYIPAPGAAMVIAIGAMCTAHRRRNFA